MRQHSTVTAVLEVVSNILKVADDGKDTLLGLLDLSAAFDTVDHAILLDRLDVLFAIRGAALSWMQSFITGRTSSTKISPLSRMSQAGQCAGPSTVSAVHC